MDFKNKFLGVLDDVRSSFWFIPCLLSVSAVVINQGCLLVDHGRYFSVSNSTLFYTGSADGARSILSTIATSMIGVAGVVFSMTLVTLSLSAQQFGARTLRSLVRDRGNQISLGIFISAFLFCLLVLRQVRSTSDGGTVFIPQLSMFISLLYGVLGILVLIYFIHHIAFMIQAPHVIANAWKDLEKALNKSHSKNWNCKFDEQTLVSIQQDIASSIRCSNSAYIRRVNFQRLSEIALRFNVTLILKKKAGDFINEGELIFDICKRSHFKILELEKIELMSYNAFSFGEQRTQQQDLRFIIGQLLSICLLALSPAVNNCLQACLCIDRLAAVMIKFGNKQKRGNFLLCEDGELLVYDEALTFEELFDLCFREIRLNAEKQLLVSVSLLEAFKCIFNLVGDERSRLVVAETYSKTFTQIRLHFPNENVGRAEHLAES